MPQIKSDLIEERAAELFHTAEADQTALGIMQVADDDILAHGEIVEQVQFLIDDADAEALRVQRSGDFDGRSAQRDGSAVGARRPGQNAREGAFAGAIFAHEGMHFAGAELEVCALEGVDAAVAFSDPGRLQVLGQVLLCRTYFRRDSNYSYRSATMGSTRAPRRAGIKAAAMPAMASSTTAAP